MEQGLSLFGLMWMAGNERGSYWHSARLCLPILRSPRLDEEKEGGK